MSPLMSITRADSDTSRTSNLVAASGMVAPFRAGDGALLVVSDRHEVRQARDLEDLAVVVGQPECGDLDVARPRLGQQPDDHRDSGAVDVVRPGEVQDDWSAAGRGLVVAALQCRLGARIDVAGEVDDRNVASPPDLDL